MSTGNYYLQIDWPDGHHSSAGTITDEQWGKVAAILAPQPAPAASPAPEVQTFQSRVLPWLLECFGQQIANDATERNHRFLEEAVELVQACGCTEDEAHALVAYVYGRAVGERAQEVGGVMVTLAALCLAQGLDMHQAGETELARITQPAMVERIREKQKRKPAMSPLPGCYPERVTAQQAERQTPTPDADQLALDAATDIMALMYGPTPAGGSVQLKAQVQCRVLDAIRAAPRPAMPGSAEGR